MRRHVPTHEPKPVSIHIIIKHDYLMARCNLTYSNMYHLHIQCRSVWRGDRGKKYLESVPIESVSQSEVAPENCLFDAQATKAQRKVVDLAPSPSHPRNIDQKYIPSNNQSAQIKTKQKRPGSITHAILLFTCDTKACSPCKKCTEEKKTKKRKVCARQTRQTNRHGNMFLYPLFSVHTPPRARLTKKITLALRSRLT